MKKTLFAIMSLIILTGCFNSEAIIETNDEVVQDLEITLEDGLTDCGSVDKSVYVEKEGTTGAFSYWTEEKNGNSTTSIHWYNRMSDEFFEQYEGEMLDFVKSEHPAEWEIILWSGDTVMSMGVSKTFADDDFVVRWILTQEDTDDVIFKENSVKPTTCTDGKWYISNPLFDDTDEIILGLYRVEILHNNDVVDSTTVSL